MIKYIFCLALLFTSFNSLAQVGINTNTPTESLDVNGTMRVRSLPTDGQANSIHTTGTNTSSGTIPTQTFVYDKPMVFDKNGVMGVTSYSNLVPNNTTINFNSTTNASPAMFVVKRFRLVDDVGGLQGKYHPSLIGYDTDMNVNDWQAIVSNISFKFLTETQLTEAQFKIDNFFNYRIRGKANDKWYIVGDIINLQEEAYIDVLFIKSAFVAADDRSL